MMVGCPIHRHTQIRFRPANHRQHKKVTTLPHIRFSPSLTPSQTPCTQNNISMFFCCFLHPYISAYLVSWQASIRVPWWTNHPWHWPRPLHALSALVVDPQNPAGYGKPGTWRWWLNSPTIETYIYIYVYKEHISYKILVEKKHKKHNGSPLGFPFRQQMWGHCRDDMKYGISSVPVVMESKRSHMIANGITMGSSWDVTMRR